MIHKVLFASAALGLAVGMTGCSSADEVADCFRICDKYSGCFDEDLDNSACTDRCEDAADQSDDFAMQADSCESCIDDADCTEGTALCSDECAGVIAESVD